jgi:conjugal transfer pilus assembly protein TraD
LVGDTIGNTLRTDHHLVHFSGSSQQNLTMTEQSLFPQHLLGQLPNFHYIAAVAGGRVIKGRLPIITD